MKKEIATLISLLASGTITYFFVTETNGDKLKKEDPAIYNGVSDNTFNLILETTKLEGELVSLKAEWENKKQEVEAMTEGDGKETAKGELNDKEKAVDKKQETISLYQGIENYGLKMPTLSLMNIVKSLAVFALLAMTIWFIFSRAILFFSKKDN